MTSDQRDTTTKLMGMAFAFVFIQEKMKIKISGSSFFSSKKHIVLHKAFYSIETLTMLGADML